MSLLSFAFTAGFVVLGIICVPTIGYLLLLLSAAAIARGRRVADDMSANGTTFAIVVPAHNEALVIGAMLASLRQLDYPKELFRVVVIADNCTDATAAIALAGGATVFERFNEAERGKGYALAEATSQLLVRLDCPDAIAIVDADTFVSANFLDVMAAAFLKAGGCEAQTALQGRYGVLNVEQGWRPALMAGAFDLFNHVKPLGREALGLSAGLKGNGMVFSRALLAVAPFSGASITEDIDYGLDLLLHHGVRVGYVPGALVKAQMPVTGAQAKSQRERWENGRFRLMRERVPALLAAALARGDVRLADAAVDLLLPPLAEIAGLLTVWTLLTCLGMRFGYLNGRAPIYVGALLFGSVGFVVYVLAGFKVADAPKDAYLALLKAPGYAIWKLATLAAKPLARLRGRSRQEKEAAPDEWIRTERISMPAPENQQAP